MGEPELSRFRVSNNGFSMIELLIAMIIIIIVMLGLLKGILEYEKFATRAKMKDKATEIAKQMSAYIESLPYVADGSGINSILYANNSEWNNITCGISCNPDLTNPAFYSVGSPNPSNPFSGISSNLRLFPVSGSFTCGCRGSNCPTTLPPCLYPGFAKKDIYLGVNIARLVSEEGGLELGKAVFVLVWYFEPYTNKFQ